MLSSFTQVRTLIEQTEICTLSRHNLTNLHLKSETLTSFLLKDSEMTQSGKSK